MYEIFPFEDYGSKYHIYVGESYTSDDAGQHIQFLVGFIFAITVLDAAHLKVQRST